MLRLAAFPMMLLAVLLAAVACSDRPDGVMRAGKMEDVLYDYHIARAIVLNEGKPDNERDRRYEEAVFAKYGITADEFYASLRYYEAHPKEFAKIYANLDERFSGADVAKSQPGSRDADQAQGNDIWTGPRFFVLSSRGVNRHDFEIQAPRNLKQGDRLEWTFDLQWVYPEGRKNGSALMVFHYANDSTATFTQPLYGTGRQTLIAPVGKVLPQRISGFIYQECPWDKKAYLLVVSNVALRQISSSVPQPSMTRPDSLPSRVRPGMRLDSAKRPVEDSMPALQPAPDQGVRLSRQEGERRILDSIRRRERGRQPHFQ